MKVSVVGAGIFGAAGALELARRGHEVTLIDPGPLPHPDASSTDLSKIVRLDYGADIFYTELMERALPRWRELNGGWGRPLFHETGFVALSSEPFSRGAFELDSFEVLTDRGHPIDRLHAADIAARFPTWSERYVDGYYNPQGGWAESGEVTLRFAKAAQVAGAVFRRGVADVEQEAAGADLVIVAAGAWTPTLVPELGAAVPELGAMRVVGQPVLHFAPEDPSVFSPPAFVPFAADISRTGWYGFCANADGIVKLANHGRGIDVDPRGDRVVPADAEPRFRAFLVDAVPTLARARCVGERLCLYCDTFDGDLWIARHPTRDRILVASGGSGHGFKFAPILGDLIADEAEGKTPPEIAARFGWRIPTGQRFEDARCRD
jgi:glycine/D-amino acid oxidase-like deaminating enzyme